MVPHSHIQQPISSPYPEHNIRCHTVKKQKPWKFTRYPLRLTFWKWSLSLKRPDRKWKLSDTISTAAFQVPIQPLYPITPAVDRPFLQRLFHIYDYLSLYSYKLCYKIGFMFYMINSTTDSPCNIILTPYCQLFLMKLSSFHCIGKWGFNCIKHEVNALSRLQSIKCVGAEGWSKKVSKNGTNVLPPLIHHIGNCLIRVAFNLWKNPWWWRMVFYAKALNILYL